jgi:hypothetical protein
MGAPASEDQRRAGPLPLAASGLALLGWVIGTPLLMVLWGGWPLSGAPGWKTFRDLPLPDVVDGVLIGAVSVALWGIWGQFAYSVVTEIVALVRRRKRAADRPEQADDVLRRLAHSMVESVTREPSLLARFTRPAAVAEAPPPEVPAEAEADVVAVRSVGPERLASALAGSEAAAEVDSTASRRDELETVAAPLAADARTDVDSWPDPTAPWQSGRRTAVEAGDIDQVATSVPTGRRRPRKGARHAKPEGTGRVDPPSPRPVARQAADPSDRPATAAPPASAGGRPGPPAATQPPPFAPARVLLGEGEVQRLDDILGEVEVLVRVLGEVDAVRPGPTSASAGEQVLPARQKALEALVYLALSDVGVSRRELERVLFPTGPTSERVLYNTVKSVLKVVGDQQPAATTGRHYVLSERVVTDYGIFCDLAAGGERAERAEDPDLSATLLGDALDLVRGEPFSGISRGYTWAAAHRATMVAQVVDVAERLAALRMASGEWEGAEDAARRGLLASPGDERLEDLLTLAAGRR